MRTRNNSRHHTGNRYLNRRSNRQGITLLFVVSMIVLFLLMGSAFMIVSNDYYKASRNRGKKHNFSVDRTALVHQAFYELIRGPELSNTASPLRAQDILSDMYGYGFKARVNGVPIDAMIPGTNLSAAGHFIELELKDPNDNTPNKVLNLLTEHRPTLPSASGFFNGRVISFVSGPAKGVSTRIIDYRVDGGGHKFIVQLPNRLERGTFGLGALENSTVIINGLAFGGTGAGAYDEGAGPATAALSALALEPNRIGESRAELFGGDGATAAGAAYLSYRESDSSFNDSGNLTGPNESYDGPDYQNMYLSGRDQAGNLIASFHRPSLDSMFRNDPNAFRHRFSAFDLNASGSFELEVDTDLDGQVDSFWMDIGLPIQTTPEGLRYKPLVAYRIVDQDGLVNLNVAGNLGDLINNTNNVRGQGYGPAELAVNVDGNPFLPDADYRNILQGNTALGLPGRYGVGVDNAPGTGDEAPGGEDRDAWSFEKLFGYPTSIDSGVGGFFASAGHDISGRLGVVRPTVSPFTELNLAQIPNGYNSALPELDFTNFRNSDTMLNSPYEANFAPNYLRGWEGDDDDELFTPLELERMIRINDVDSNLLPGRLVALAPGVATDTTRRASITTESYEVPMAPGFVLNNNGMRFSLNALLRARLNGGGNADLVNGNAAQDDLVREYLSRELLVGMKMDVNRVFGNGRDDDNNGVVDDPGETNESNIEQRGNPPMDLDNDYQAGNNEQLARYKFAKQLYILTLLTTEDSALSFFGSVEEYRTAVAQWCINVVDFRDPDSIHTPFEFDTNPWNGWSVDGDIATDDSTGQGAPADRSVVWGTERPELLLTESFGSHDRRTEDREDDNGDMANTANGDTDWDSHKIPQSSVYLELYNPWTHSDRNQILPAELGDGANSGVDLQKTSPAGDPVWRIGFKRAAADANFLRSVVFTNTPTPSFTDGGTEVFYNSIATDLPEVLPGRYAVVGSSGNVPEAGGEYRTTFGRLSTSIEGSPATLRVDEIRSISLVPDMNQIVRNRWDPTTSTMVETQYDGIAVVIDQPRSLSVSDPDGGYDGMNNTTYGANPGDGHVAGAVRDEPFDASGRQVDDDAAIWRNGTTDNFRVVELQRLANPLLDWDAVINPYITIDTTSLDLTSFNGLTADPNNNTINPERLPPAGVAAVSNGDTDLGSLERGEADSSNHIPFGAELVGAQNQSSQQEMGGQHNLGFVFEETFGLPNSSFGDGANFAWLTWNNRPYVSHLELTNVPFSSPENLTADFTTRVNGDPYTAAVGGNPLKSKFGHLLNFYGFDQTANPMLGNFYQLLDFLEVPSRYVGTEQWLNPQNVVGNNFLNPFDFVSHYRYPGKINLNTIPNESVYNVLMGDYATGSNGVLRYGDFRDSRWRDDSDPSTSDFFRPYRNSTEGNLVAEGVPVEENVDCGLLRRNASGAPLFEADSTDAYFQNAMRQRLGNLATTRSSVFAIWITVGYFEVDENGDLMDVASGGVEIGADTGGATRNRGFFIFDRSIPVAYEPGKNHNIERAILVQSIIE